MKIEPISVDLANQFLNWDFFFEKIEQDVVIAYIARGDGPGNITVGLPAGTGFFPNSRNNYPVRMTVLEGFGKFHQFGVYMDYSRGSTFNIGRHSMHGFIQVMTPTVFTKTILDPNVITAMYEELMVRFVK